MVVNDSFYNDIPNIRTNSYDKKFIIINGNVQNEHKPKIMYAFTELNLWDNSYWSFDKLTNFGMKIYQHRQDLFQIFKNPLWFIGDFLLLLGYGIIKHTPN